MKRFAILLVAALVAVAAPARVWCEASCLAPAQHSEHSAEPHCPGHESSSATPVLSAGDLDDCPVVESARPTTAKFDVARSTPATTWHVAPEHLGNKAPTRPRTDAPRHLTTIPLRI